MCQNDNECHFVLIYIYLLGNGLINIPKWKMTKSSMFQRPTFLDIIYYVLIDIPEE